MKIVINKCFGGFGLSEKAYSHMGIEWDGYGHGSSLERTDPKLIECVETLGKDADGRHAALKVIEIPDDVEYIIEEYDGSEHIAEVHRTWY